jgi:hypothetical protein
LGGKYDDPFVDFVDRSRDQSKRLWFRSDLGCRRLLRAIVSRGMKKAQHQRDKIIAGPGMEEHLQRAPRNALSTPPKHRTAPTPKPKERPASKGRVHKGRTRG